MYNAYYTIYNVARTIMLRYVSALGVSHVMRSINVRYLLTYLLIPVSTSPGV